MRSDFNFSTDMLFGLLNSMWTQIRAGLVVGLPAEDESRLGAAPGVNSGGPQNRYAIRSLDDYAGYQTRNGLGSMDIGGSRSRIDE
jgi:hypothetical protein